MKLTFLGTGTSFGVPKIGCRCPVCLSPDPRDKRNRVGAVVETRRRHEAPHRHAARAAAATDRRGHRPGGRGRVHARPRRSHARHRRPARDHGATARRRSPFTAPRRRWTSWRQKFRYIFDDRIRPLPGTSKPRGQGASRCRGRVVLVGDMEVLPCRGAARECHGLCVSHRADRLRHGRQVAAAGRAPIARRREGARDQRPLSRPNIQRT